MITKQPQRAANGSPRFSLSDLLRACVLPDGRIIVPPNYAELTLAELDRLSLVAESAVTLAGAIASEVRVTGEHHTVREILALCANGLTSADDLPRSLIG